MLMEKSPLPRADRKAGQPDTGGENVNGDGQTWLVRVYISCENEKSRKMVASLNRALTEMLSGNYEIELINILNSPEQAVEDDVIATPCLIRKRPGPELRIIGDLTDYKKIMVGLQGSRNFENQKKLPN